MKNIDTFVINKLHSEICVLERLVECIEFADENCEFTDTHVLYENTYFSEASGRKISISSKKSQIAKKNQNFISRIFNAIINVFKRFFGAVTGRGVEIDKESATMLDTIIDNNAPIAIAAVSALLIKCRSKQKGKLISKARFNRFVDNYKSGIFITDDPTCGITGKSDYFRNNYSDGLPVYMVDDLVNIVNKIADAIDTFEFDHRHSNYIDDIKSRDVNIPSFLPKKPYEFIIRSADDNKKINSYKSSINKLDKKFDKIIKKIDKCPTLNIQQILRYELMDVSTIITESIKYYDAVDKNNKQFKASLSKTCNNLSGLKAKIQGTIDFSKK